MQSRKGSLLEACCSTVVGFVLSTLLQLYLFWLHDIKASLGLQVEMVLWFTVLSVVRGYLTRRVGNWLTMRQLRKEENALHQ